MVAREMVLQLTDHHRWNLTTAVVGGGITTGSSEAVGPLGVGRTVETTHALKATGKGTNNNFVNLRVDPVGMGMRTATREHREISTIITTTIETEETILRILTVATGRIAQSISVNTTV
jgi:hypothetical protein